TAYCIAPVRRPCIMSVSRLPVRLPREIPPMRRSACLIALLFAPAVHAAKPVDFNREVRPILAGKCFLCHGPDDKARKAGLRLDLRDTATKELKSGNRAVVP